MRKTFRHTLVALAGLILFCACQKAADNSPVTVFVTHGIGREYYEKLAADVKEKYGIEIEFRGMMSTNASDQLKLEIRGGGLPADIVFSNYRLPDEDTDEACLNLLTHSHIADAFTYGRIKECTRSGGAVYQLPICSRLIGISYNATLLKEMGWELPRNFDDMLSLKAKCEQAGIKFAVTDLSLTGFGFNYLFHIMGAQWLSGLEGDEWLDAFREGREQIGRFEAESDYFRRWVEEGLFGDLTSGKAYEEFAAQRALFCFSILNYEAGKGGDEFGSMPWISGDGSSNCFTCYDNLWVLADKRLLEKGKGKKLEKVCRILDYISDKDFSEYVKSLSPDIYLSLNSFEVSPDRLYSEYGDHIRAGFLQPWYYNRFGSSAIVNVGEEVNSYMLGCAFGGNPPENLLEKCLYNYDSEASFGKIFRILEEEEEEEEEEESRGERTAGLLGTVAEPLDFERTAAVSAISGALALQESLGEEAEVNVALLPYTRTLDGVQPWLNIAVSDTRLYPGPFYYEHVLVLSPVLGHDVCAVRMTGKEIRKIVSSGYNPSGWIADGKTFRKDPYPYVCVVKGGEEVRDAGEYVVSVGRQALEKDVWEKFEASGKVVSRGGRAVIGEISDGVPLFFKQVPEVNTKNIVWK